MLLLILFLVCLAVQMGYLLACTRLLRPEPTAAAPPERVSVIVCAHNERPRLPRLLAALRAQTHPDFEVIVVDDRSDDGTFDWLQRQARGDARIRPVRVVNTPPGVSPKKWALTQGVRAAGGKVLLLTDADCCPVGPEWIVRMQSRCRGAHEVVLGLGFYHRAPGWLNRLIRFETLTTAVRYVTLARWGCPYMGVGRNLAYRPTLFAEHGGLHAHRHVLSGDDDLFVNAVSRPGRVAVCTHPAARTLSEPKRTWRGWYRQKRRHMSAGRHYRPRDQWRLSALEATHIGVWVLGAALLAGSWWELATFGLTLRAGAQSLI
ncbi:MAG: glycosyltransferase, partial [Catalinimonas sp.]